MPIRTTAILNLKGGVAKTTTAINMAAILSRKHGKRVLLIDADSQCNTTEFFVKEQWPFNLASLLRVAAKEDMPREDLPDYIHSTGWRNIDIIPGDDSLMDLDLSKVEQKSVNAGILRTLLDGVGFLYDYCIIDCPPAFNAACAAALVAADDVIIPIKLDAFALRGMANLMRQVENMRRINPRLRVAGVLPTMWYRAPETEDAVSQLQTAGFRIFPRIRRSDKVDRMTFAQDPLMVCSPNSAAGVDYKKFVDEYKKG